MSEYRIDIKGDATQFAATTQRVMGKLNTMTSSAMAFAARTLLPFASASGAAMFTRSTLAWADQLNNLSQRTTLNVETLQELDYTAKLTSTSLAAFTESVRYLVRAQISAQAGQGRFADAFERLGISATELTQLNPEQLFRRVAGALKGGEMNSQRMSDIFQIMGERGAQLIPAMTTGLDTFAEAARAAGIVVEESLVKQLARANAEWDTLMAKGKAAAIPLVRQGLIAAETTAAQAKHVLRMLRPSMDPEESRHQRDQDLLRVFEKYDIAGFGREATTTTPLPVEIVEDRAGSNAAAVERRSQEQVQLDNFARAGLFTTTGMANMLQARSLNKLDRIAAEVRSLREVTQRLGADINNAL
jgi:hypothetical protein